MIENFHKENSRWFVKPKSAHFNPACESGCCESLVLVFQWLSCLHTFSGYGKCNWPHCDSPFSSLWGVRLLSLLWQLLPFEISPLIFSLQRLSLNPLVSCLPQLPSSCQVSAASLSEPNEHQWALLTLNPLSFDLQGIFSCLSLPLSKIHKLPF